MKKETISYKEAISEIEDIIQQVESEELDIDILSEKVKRVSNLIKLCKNKLQKTETEVENILKSMEE